MRQKHFPALLFVLLAMMLALCPVIACRPIQPGVAGSQTPILDTPSELIATEQSQEAHRQPLASSSAVTDPVLYFSDITSGPKSGNSDISGGRSGLDGAIITVWGRNLGGAQAGSKVFANGVEAASYYTWGNATAPADLYTYHQMQMVSFQISHLAQDGLGVIYIIVNGKQSNSLP